MDTGRQADEGWLLDIQRKLYEWSQGNPDEAYRDMWNWVTDPRNLRCAWRRVASNLGKRTPGIDGETVESIVRRQGVLLFLEDLVAHLEGDRHQERRIVRQARLGNEDAVVAGGEPLLDLRRGFLAVELAEELLDVLDLESAFLERILLDVVSPVLTHWTRL